MSRTGVRRHSPFAYPAALFAVRVVCLAEEKPVNVLADLEPMALVLWTIEAHAH